MLLLLDLLKIRPYCAWSMKFRAAMKLELERRDASYIASSTIWVCAYVVLPLIGMQNTEPLQSSMQGKHRLSQRIAHVAFITILGTAENSKAYLMPRSIDEGDLTLAFTTVHLAGVGSNSLRDTASLPSRNLGLAYEVEQ